MMTDQFPSLNSMVVSKFTNNPLPSRFEEYSEQSSFIANSWEWLATLALIIIILVINYLLFQINSKFIKLLYLPKSKAYYNGTTAFRHLFPTLEILSFIVPWSSLLYRITNPV